MNGKNFLKLIKLSLLIAVILAISGCHTCPEPVHVTYSRPSAPLRPDHNWIDIPGYYALDDNTTEWDDLESFWDKYEGYQEKIDNLLNAYEAEPEQ